MEEEQIIEQIDRVLVLVEDAKRRARQSDLSDLSETELSRLNTAMFATVDRLAPPRSAYQRKAKGLADKYGPGFETYIVLPLAGILQALRQDYVDGYMASVEELLHASVFADFLEMAEHLRAEGYKDPAAVLCGGVLEEHLHALADKNSMESADDSGRPLKADRLNADLASGGVYSKLDQKSVTAWLDLRNKAAHAHYGEYSADQVGLFIQGVRDFLARHPA